MSPATTGLAVTIVAAAVGAIVGALLPLVAYRLSVPIDDPPRRACHACGAALAVGPMGFLGRPARCAGCGARLGPPAWLTALLGGASCGLIAAAMGADPALPLFVALCLLGVLLGAVDVACKRLPHALVVPAIWLGLTGFTVIAALMGDWAALLRAVLGGAALGAAFLVLYVLPGGGVGYGDVKLAVLLGLFLGWLGWREVLLGGVLPWLLNGPVVLALLLTRRVGRKSFVPFGPALLGGALLAVLVGSGLDLGRTGLM